MITCIAIDSNKESIKLISQHIKKIPQLNLIKTFNASSEAINFCKKNEVNIVFTDIYSPELCFKFIQSLRNQNKNNSTSFILTTQYSKFAIAAFDEGISDYLLKPIDFERFKRSIERVSNNFKISESAMEITNGFFFADSNGQKIKIKFEDIVYVESAGNYVMIIGNKLKVMIYKSMMAMEKMLSSGNFIRTHKSYIVSINHIKSVKGNECMLEWEEQRKCIPIGTTFRMAVLKKLKIRD